MVNKTTKVETIILPIYHDWDTKNMWKLCKPFLFQDDEGKYHIGPLDREPDGEPIRFDIVLTRGEKAYERASEEDCNCDLTSGEMCPHWRKII